MIATDTLIKSGDAADGSSGGGGTGGGGGGGVAWALGKPPSGMSRQDSEDVLGSLLAEGMPDREAAANLEDVAEGEVG